MKLPLIVRVRVHENTRRLHRLLELGRDRLLNVTARSRTEAIWVLKARMFDQRAHATHALTTGLAKTHGALVVESFRSSGMLEQKHIPGAQGILGRAGLTRTRYGSPPVAAP